MEAQLRLDLKDRQQRAEEFDQYFAGQNYSRRALSVLRLLFLFGESQDREGEHLTLLKISRDQAARLTKQSKNTFLAGVEELEAAGLVARIAIETPHIYVANWSRIAKYAPPKALDPLEHLAFRSGAGQAPVRPGQGARAVNNRVSKTRVLPCPVSVPCTTSAAAQISPREKLPPLPWANLQDPELISAVDRLDLALLGHLYAELLAMAARKGWACGLADCEDNRQKFFALCHHAVKFKKAGKIGSAMGVLTSRCKRGLDVSRITHESDQWAGAVLARLAHPEPRITVPPFPPPVDLSQRLCASGRET